MAKSKAALNTAQCPYCKEWVKSGATRCPHCQAEYNDGDLASMKAARKSNLIGCGVLALVAVLGLAFCTSSGDEAADTGDTPLSETVIDTSNPLTAAAPDPAAGLTSPQRNARRSAETYLAMAGFSRKGLIDQLSSSAGDGYSLADATAAVDSLTVDYNEQAARAARNYLEMTGFSCSGLIQQLSSSAGDDYTRAQAEYGARQAGAC